MLNETLLNHGNINNTMKLARREFGSIKVDKSIQKPRIGIIGEFYLRWHAFSNNNFFEMIEKLGGEILDVVESIGRIALFFISGVTRIFVRPFQADKIIDHTWFIGVKSLFVIILTGTFTGMVQIGHHGDTG